MLARPLTSSIFAYGLSFSVQVAQRRVGLDSLRLTKSASTNMTMPKAAETSTDESESQATPRNGRLSCYFCRCQRKLLQQLLFLMILLLSVCCCRILSDSAAHGSRWNDSAEATDVAAVAPLPPVFHSPLRRNLQCWRFFSLSVVSSTVAATAILQWTRCVTTQLVAADGIAQL